jgi:hypothetical protein
VFFCTRADFFSSPHGFFDSVRTWVFFVLKNWIYYGAGAGQLTITSVRNKNSASCLPTFIFSFPFAHNDSEKHQCVNKVKPFSVSSK